MLQQVGRADVLSHSLIVCVPGSSAEPDGNRTLPRQGRLVGLAGPTLPRWTAL